MLTRRRLIHLPDKVAIFAILSWGRVLAREVRRDFVLGPAILVMAGLAIIISRRIAELLPDGFLKLAVFALAGATLGFSLVPTRWSSYRARIRSGPYGPWLSAEADMRRFLVVQAVFIFIPAVVFLSLSIGSVRFMEGVQFAVCAVVSGLLGIAIAVSPMQRCSRDAVKPEGYSPRASRQSLLERLMLRLLRSNWSLFAERFRRRVGPVSLPWVVVVLMVLSAALTHLAVYNNNRDVDFGSEIGIGAAFLVSALTCKPDIQIVKIAAREQIWLPGLMLKLAVFPGLLALILAATILMSASIPLTYVVPQAFFVFLLTCLWAFLLAAHHIRIKSRRLVELAAAMDVGIMGVCVIIVPPFGFAYLLVRIWLHLKRLEILRWGLA